MANANRIALLLLRTYPKPKLALHFSNPLELLVAVILSAQCADVRVNEVTRTLFKKYRSVRDYAEADLAVFEEEIRPTGFYKNKAKLVINCCRKLLEDFHGEIPATVDELVTLPGVGRKTANMVLGNAFDTPGIAVDTHVLRVSNRLGLVCSDSADEVEKQLMQQIPRAQWTPFTNALILHGRETCIAKKPACGRCALYEACEWPDKPERS
ncbi:endonuclease III [Cupriavidus sp. IDO]|uniref:endonuclease III n=1 Tax=Cupriavidus sp. IDO TaxID=1539142 RepID=UPI0005795889|nr:endonuclease III [Cupriavidus sp. IDO]KWR87606.1 endonuclease III [Cupriavidus sp. IDO]